MENRHEMQEALLRSWMAMEVCIRGNRLLADFSMNEMLICNILFDRRCSEGPPVTATELCTRTRLLKSQMNHILTSMEAQGLIRRERSAADRRAVYVHLQEEAVPRYLQEHAHVMCIVARVSDALGEKNTQTLTELMLKASAAVNQPEEEF